MCSRGVTLYKATGLKLGPNLAGISAPRFGLEWVEVGARRQLSSLVRRVFAALPHISHASRHPPLATVSDDDGCGGEFCNLKTRHKAAEARVHEVFWVYSYS